MLVSVVLPHLGYALSALSWGVRDIIWLRTLAVAASACFLAANLLATEINPQTLVWQCLFVGVNLTRISLEVRERRRAALDEADEELLATVFPGFNRVEFAKLRRLAIQRDLAEGGELTRQGEPVTHLLLLTSGRCEVLRRGGAVAELRDGAWIGEMGFISERPASATVVCRTPCRVLAWDVHALRGLLARNPAIAVSLQGLFGRELANRLAQADSILRTPRPDGRAPLA